jgi:hypothetical protein
MTHELDRQYGGSISKKQLLELVRYLSRLNHKPVNRPAQRQKLGLICWLCQYCPEILATGTIPPKNEEEPMENLDLGEEDLDWETESENAFFTS